MIRGRSQVAIFLDRILWQARAGESKFVMRKFGNRPTPLLSEEKGIGDGVFEIASLWTGSQILLRYHRQ